MGCCVSTDIAKTNNNNKKKLGEEAPSPSKDSNTQILQDRALVPEPEATHFVKPITKPLSPPLSLEEETVKEVLSETPTVPKPQQQQQQQKLMKLPTFPKIQEEQQQQQPPQQEKIKQGSKTHHEIYSEEDEEAEESEMYSFMSESGLSTSAITSTTTTDQRVMISRDYEDDGSSELTQKLHHHLHRPTTPSKTPGARKRPVPNRSPARRSPAKRAGENSGQLGMGLRDMGQSQTAARRRILAGNGARGRDSGESSWRRSGSPVARAEAVGRPGVCRSPSSRRVAAAAEGSPGRSTVEGHVREEDHWVSKESLEDPLVSLECFIFL